MGLLPTNHLLIAGSTGSGKSNAMKDILLDGSCFDRNRMNNRFILIDPKRVELAMFKKLKTCNGFYTEKEDSAKGLKNAYDVMEKRYRLMEKNERTDWYGTSLYIFIDEVAELTSTMDRKYNREIIELLSSLARLGRAAHVYLVIATQYPTSKVLPMQLLQNIEARLCFRQASAVGYRVVLGSSKNIPQLPVGTCIYRHADGTLEIKRFSRFDNESLKMNIETFNEAYRKAPRKRIKKIIDKDHVIYKITIIVAIIGILYSFLFNVSISLTLFIIMLGIGIRGYWIPK